MAAFGRFSTNSKIQHTSSMFWTILYTPPEEVHTMNTSTTATRQTWNKGKLVGQKKPLRLKDIWAIRVRLQLADKTRELALFEIAIDSKLRACDLVKLRVRDVAHGDRVSSRAIVTQQKTMRPVQFEIDRKSV